MKVDLNLLSNMYQPGISSATEKFQAPRPSENQYAQNVKTERLQSIQRMVVNHELSHMLPGGPHNSTPIYEYKESADGKDYIVAGGVSVKMQTHGKHEDVLRQMDMVKRAALTPTGPSLADFVVAGKAIAIKNYEKAQQVFKEENRPLEDRLKTQGNSVSIYL